MQGYPYVAYGIPAHTPSPHAVQSRSRSPPAKNNEEVEHPISEIGAELKADIRDRDIAKESQADVDTHHPIATAGTVEVAHAAEHAAAQPQSGPQVWHYILCAA